MTRVVKRPEERLQEFLDTAELLFNRKGYESTTVNDIISEMGVAKGAFYHYFTSKEEVLSAILDRIAARTEEALAEISGRDGLTAPEKVLAAFDWVVRFRSENGIFDIIHDKENALVHHKVTSEYAPRFISPLIGIVKQGIQEGAFRTDYPEECATGLLLAWNISERSLLHPGSPERLEHSIRATQDLMERILGAEPGALDGFGALWGDGREGGR